MNTNTDTEQHSPLPWQHCSDGIYSADGFDCIIESRHINGTRNAAYIVRACNNAERLAEALREITERYALLDARLVAEQHNEANGTIERAREALAAWEGGQQ